jgi:hypothetical protein
MSSLAIRKSLSASRNPSGDVQAEESGWKELLVYSCLRAPKEDVSRLFLDLLRSEDGEMLLMYLVSSSGLLTGG